MFSPIFCFPAHLSTAQYPIEGLDLSSQKNDYISEIRNNVAYSSNMGIFAISHYSEIKNMRRAYNFKPVRLEGTPYFRA
jgi:hypothetical protein